MHVDMGQCKGLIATLCSSSLGKVTLLVCYRLTLSVSQEGFHVVELANIYPRHGCWFYDVALAV